MPTFSKTSVLKFIIARAKHAEDWVLYSHISICTRGCAATGRCESEHGHSRNAGINGNCSWLLTIMRYESIRNARKTRRMRWIDRQLDGVLARGPTNPSDTTLSTKNLETLDRELLPWMLDSIEEQMLLGRIEGLRCDYISRTAAGKHVFQVYFEDAEKDDTVSVADRTRTEPEQSDNFGEEEADNDETGDVSKRSKSWDVEEETEEWTSDMQQELVNSLERPLPEHTNFIYTKIRIVTLMPDPKNATKLIGTCSCGYCNRIGFACRHFFCMLFTVLRFRIVSIDGAHSVINMCDCASSPRSCIQCMEKPHFKKFEWGDFDFMSLINLDIGSKMKYHATLRSNFDCAAAFPALHYPSFYPRIAAYIFAPFALHNEPVSSRSILRSGIPENHIDNPENEDWEDDESDSQQQQPPSSRRRSSGIRSEVPTLPRLINDLQRIWERTERLKDTKSQKPRSTARALILSTMRILEDQVTALHPDLAPKRTTRYYSRRDRYIGNARRGQK